jgi:hypothetical protein
MGFMNIAARRVLSVVSALALVVGMGVLGGASASAEVVHNFEFGFDGSATPNGSFEGGLGTVAVDQTSGDVYVEQWQAGVVYRFDAAGKYLGEITGAAVPQRSLGLFYWDSGMAVDNSAGANKGDLYIAGTENGVVYRFDSSGKLLSELNGSGSPAGSFSPCGVAVDSSGNVYVADRANDVVDKFTASGAYAGQTTSSQIVQPASIAVDASDNVYLTNFGQSVVKLEPGGGASVLDGSKARSVAVDPATGHVYVAEEVTESIGRIVEFDPSGSRLGALGEERLSHVFGIAVHGATGEVYAADYSHNLIDVFGPGLVIPDVTSGAASNVQPTGVTLNGTVNPDGLPVSSCEFEYGTSISYGQAVACEQSSSAIGSGMSPVPVSVSVSGLVPDTTYHFRLVVSNTNGANRGVDVAVTTSGPPLIDAESAAGVARTSATLEAQIDPSGFDTTYRFEYGTSASYGTSVPVPDADIGSGLSDVPVSQSIGGLRSGVTYHYRVVATNSQGRVDGPDRTFTTVPPAYIDAEYATNVASTSATLNANVNPIGTSTEYRLEYGTSTAYGQTFTGNTGEVIGDVLVSRHPQELQPGTTYHYRIVAQNAFGTVEGADHVFTTQVSTTQVSGSALTLSDGRAWELVSPADKKGALIEPFALLGQVKAASAGNMITYTAEGPHVGENPRDGRISQVLSTRESGGGWSSLDITLSARIPAEGEQDFLLKPEQQSYPFFSEDLSLATVFSEAPRAEGVKEGTLYFRNNLDGSFSPLVSEANVPPGTEFGGGGKLELQMRVLAVTPDMSHVVFASPLALVPPAVRNGQAWNLYEWGAGRVQLINVLPDGTVASSEPNVEGGQLLGGESFPSQDEPNGGVRRAVSNDGRRVAWTWGDPYSTSGGFKGLYVRDTVEGTTVHVGGAAAFLQMLSADGSSVFYMEAGDLYGYDFATGTTTDLTGAHGPGKVTAGVQELVLGAGEDGSAVYFVANGVLSGAPNPRGERATPGQCVKVSNEDARLSPPGATCNLYVVHNNGKSWEDPRFIATLSADDEPSWLARDLHGSPDLANVSAQVSGNGRYLAFNSDRSLTGYDNTDALSGQPDEEVYLYDFTANRLVCVSCNPTGARPVGVNDSPQQPLGLLVDRIHAWSEDSLNRQGHWLAGNIPSWREHGNGAGTYQPRALSDSGRVFFNSPDALVPQATNGLEDVYEYEPPAGPGMPVSDSCTTASVSYSPRSGGCVSLMSSGVSNEESVFYDASESGDDVFFVTLARLAGEDYDTSFDVYDAHACSPGAPCRTEVVSSPPCTSGDSCKPAPAPQPEIFGAAPSATFNGVGNVSEQPKVTVKHKTRKPTKHKKHKKHGKRKGRKASRSSVHGTSGKGQG